MEYYQNSGYYPQSYPQGYQQQAYGVPYQQPEKVMQQAQQIVLQGYPVPNEQTAREAQVDTNGMISVFPDIQNGKIYTKQLDTRTLMPVFKVYCLEQGTEQVPQGYVPVGEFQQLQQQVMVLAQKMQELEELKAPEKKGGRANVSSNATNDGK